MKRSTHAIIQLICLGLLSTACSSKSGDDQGTSTPAPAGDSAPISAPPPADADAERPSLSRADCEAKGGHVVGDIGDGAIHRPDYVCEGGQPPIATIQPGADEPIAAEGEVCCQ